MSDDIYLKLPWPPTFNMYFDVGVKRINRSHGQEFVPVFPVSDIGRRYREIVSQAARSSVRLEGNLSLRLVGYPPDRRPRQIYKIFRVVMDSLKNAHVIDDEALIKEVHMKKVEPIEKGIGFIELVVTKETI